LYAELIKGKYVWFSGERLALTLRFLASGETLHSLRYSFRVGVSTAHSIVRSTSQAIFLALSPTYMKVPSSPDEWETIANDFHNIWNFTHCVGALDGKHIRISCPALCGSQFCNYKNFHSIANGISGCQIPLHYY
jgi:hypothetical protein